MADNLPLYVVIRTNIEQLQAKLNDQATYNLAPISIFFQPGEGIIAVFKRGGSS